MLLKPKEAVVRNPVLGFPFECFKAEVPFSADMEEDGSVSSHSVP